MNLDAIKDAVMELSCDDYTDLRQWIIERGEVDDWDRQIEADALSGRLQAAIERSQAENPGPSIPLETFLAEEEAADAAAVGAKAPPHEAVLSGGRPA